MDERVDSLWVYGELHATTRFIPASTFKIAHTLFALDAGIVRDEFQVFIWDGTQHWLTAWNSNQNLRSSMRNSTVWVFQQFATKIGEQRMSEYLDLIDYGNADMSGGIDRFWLDGALRISAFEQIALLRKLYRNELPFREEHQRLLKDVMIVEADRNYILRAKTGWAARATPSVLWWVGWVERDEGAVFFAIIIVSPPDTVDGRVRETIGRAVLRSIDALPPN